MTAAGRAHAARAAASPALSTIVLPDDFAYRREHVLPREARGPGYDAQYDETTLAYDVLALPESGIVRLFCPKLLNLTAVVKQATWTLDDRPARLLGIKRHRHFDTVELAAREGAERLGVVLDGWRAEVPVARQDRRLDGMNCLLTVSRDNDLRWLADWARFNVSRHGADAALVFDNGSTRYTPQDVAATLEMEGGLKTALVLSIDRPYGPIGLKKQPHRHRGKFLQGSMLNIARQRFLGGARAVLVTDVDELVVGEGSIFDAAARHWSGYVQFPGEWRFPRPLPSGAVPRHRDHVLRETEPGDCPRKYCVVPSRQGMRTWTAHGIDGVILPPLHRIRSHAYIHCQGISTFWKTAGARPRPTQVMHDAALATLFEQVFA